MKFFPFQRSLFPISILPILSPISFEESMKHWNTVRKRCLFSLYTFMSVKLLCPPENLTLILRFWCNLNSIAKQLNILINLLQDIFPKKLFFYILQKKISLPFDRCQKVNSFVANFFLPTICLLLPSAFFTSIYKWWFHSLTFCLFLGLHLMLQIPFCI